MTPALQNPPAASPPLNEGDLAEVIRAFNDLTGRLQVTHDQLRGGVARLKGELSEANARLERSRRLAALGEMAAGIAHEVRNPLASIRLYGGMLEQDLGDRPREREIAGKVLRAVAGLDAVVGDVLTFAREFRIEPRDVEVGGAFARAFEAATDAGPPTWPRIAGPRAGEGWGLIVRADPGLLHRALVNVIRNAMEAMAERPGAHALWLGARAQRGARGDEAGVVLFVRDSGPGVSPGVAERMFNPFFTTRAAGTGLGLAIVHRIMDAHGGRIRIANHAPPPGATAELVFPGGAGAGAGGDGLDLGTENFS